MQHPGTLCNCLEHYNELTPKSCRLWRRHTFYVSVRWKQINIGLMDMSMSKKICFAYSINSTLSVGLAKLYNLYFLNGGGKNVYFHPVHNNSNRFIIPWEVILILFFFNDGYECLACALLCLPVFHISDQQVATLTGGNVMLWQRFLLPVLSSPFLLRAITVKCVHRWSNVVSLQSK